MSAPYRVASIAQLENLGGAHLPPVALPVAGEFQYCVDAGAAAAVCLFADAEFIGLSDHIALALRGFKAALERFIAAGAGMRGSAPRRAVQPRMRACIAAFEAGYLGRIQQEKRAGAMLVDHAGIAQLSNVDGTPLPLSASARHQSGGNHV
ncbi:hypothetical protein [Rugamonas sp.]|uniref:hypothetical protein n=1 Tax=Rugamonas sp. TaxID=1926287 RepID=UPI0025F1720B|nr:hypothetical protein [Rugamonas sp.]